MWEPMTTKTLTELPTDFQILEEESKSEGFNFLSKMKMEWESGKNRFNKTGEKLFGIFEQDKLIAIGGINIDPYVSDASTGRVRHLYVLNNYPKKKAGATLMEKIIAHGSIHFTKLRLRTDTIAASLFYENIGFKTVENKSASHEWNY